MSRGLLFSVTVDDAKAVRALGIIRRFGGDQRELLDEWGGVLEASTRSRFDRGKGPGGVPWIPSRRVIAAAAPGKSIGPRQGGKTLVDKGNLERSLRYEVRDGHTLLVGVDGASESAKNAAAHQFGVERLVVVVVHTRVINQAFGVPLATPVTVKVRGHARKMKLPARPFLGIDDEDKRDLKDTGREYLRELLRR